MLWVGLFFPSLPLDVFARASDASDAAQPFIVTSGGHYPRVGTANAAARAAGIRRDQLVSAALALAPDVAMRERDVAAEEAALADIATLVLAFTPDVALAPPCAIVAEIAGSARLFGDLSRLVEHIHRTVRSCGYD
ncbi:MAG TPA: DNA polymerase Y family protein, partial [Casimicrobiaceae bacterium]|nr:DNA polymerase Y family protein [Casimicrobiaceae bacterium]